MQFVAGDIDPAVVVSSLYNDKGSVDSQGNQLGGSAADGTGNSGTTRPASAARPVDAPDCRISITESSAISVKTLDARRREIAIRQASRSYRFEVRLTCDQRPSEDVYAEAGFSRCAGEWWPTAGSGSQRAELRVTSTWTGVAGVSFQGNVCRSVAGRSKSDAKTFYAEFCIPEHDYREIHRIFDRVELNMVLSPP